MGIVEPHGGPLSGRELTTLLTRARKIGIAREPARRFDNVEAITTEDAEALLQMVIAALEASPVPKFEWPAVSRVLDDEQLASLLGISESSLRRYASGERATPDAVAARLHHVALIVGDLAGAYNDVGIRRWFDRRRTALDDRAPASLLKGAWNPDDAGPQAVRALARSLVTFSAT